MISIQIELMSLINLYYYDHYRQKSNSRVKLPKLKIFLMDSYLINKKYYFFIFQLKQQKSQ